jgi:hypothetical protein
VSFDAIRWALDQPIKATAKLLLVAMGDCVNAAGGEMLCWPSYRHLADRTGLDVKTVEAGVRRLREDGLISDTGSRNGRTGGVVVYRLNIPKNGVASDRQSAPAEPPSEPENGGVAQPSGPKNGASSVNGSDPVFPASDPNFPDKRPQFSLEATPKTGYGIRKGIKKGTRKESGSAITSIPGVPPETFADWMAARKRKAVTPSVMKLLEREAAKAGLSVPEAVTACAELGWQGFNAGWYADRTRGTKHVNGHARPLNAQEALEESNRAVAARFLEKDHATH